MQKLPCSTPNIKSFPGIKLCCLLGSVFQELYRLKGHLMSSPIITKSDHLLMIITLFDSVFQEL